MYYFFVTLQDVTISSLISYEGFNYSIMSCSFFDFIQFLDFNDIPYSIDYVHSVYLSDKTLNDFLSDEHCMVYYFKNSNV